MSGVGETSDCARFVPLLPAFTGASDPAAQASALRQHLRECRSCRREAADYQQAGQVLRQAAHAHAEAAEPSFSRMHEQIMDRIAALRDGAEPVLAPRTPRWRRVGPVLLATAALLLIAFGIELGVGAPTPSVWDRSSIAVPKATGVQVLPYSGARAEVRPVGLERSGSAESGIGPGMRGRGAWRVEVEDFDIAVEPAILRQRR